MDTSLASERLLSAEMLNGLSPEKLAHLSSLCHWQKHPMGQQIIRYGDHSDEAIFLQQGEVQIIRYGHSGRPVVFHYHNGCDVLGDISAIDGKPRSADVVAVTEVVTASMPASVFQQLLRDSPTAMMWELQRLARKLRDITEQQLELVTLPVNQRLCSYLLQSAESDSGHGDWASPLPASHEDIAARIGSQREAVTKSMRELEQKQAIRRSGRKIEVNTLRLRDILQNSF